MAFARKARLGLILLAAALPRPNQSAEPRLSDTQGKPVALSHCWGKPTVVFYEDRYSTRLNEDLKDELFRRGKEGGLLTAASVLAIANVRGYDWFPARNFVLSAVRDAEKVWGIPVYLDWEGDLSQPPWDLSDKGSTVLVVDPNGSALYAKNGVLSRQEADDVFALLRRLVGR